MQLSRSLSMSFAMSFDRFRCLSMSFDRYADVSRCLSIATIDVFRSLAMPFDRFRSLAMSFDRFRTRTPLSPSRAHDRIIAHADASSSCGSCLRREDRMPLAPAVEPFTRSRYRVKNSHSLWTLAGGRWPWTPPLATQHRERLPSIASAWPCTSPPTCTPAPSYQALPAG